MFKAEKRLNDEQKFLYKFRRQEQAEAKVLSEEEIRRRQKEKRVNSWHDIKKSFQTKTQYFKKTNNQKWISKYLMPFKLLNLK